MRKNKRNVLCLILAVIILSLQFKSDVLAEDANDIFSLYNEATVVETSQLQAEYNQALSNYQSALSDAASAEQFNTLFETAEEYQSQKKDEINSKIQEVLDENNSIAIQIGDNVEGDWDQLKLLESKYNANKEHIQQLLNERDKYILTAKRSIDYATLDELSAEVDVIEEKYTEVAVVGDLGEVNGVRFPLNADTNITSEYGYRLDPITGNSISFHAGLDLSANVGTEVVSLFNGIVAGTGYSSVAGNYVRVDHGNGITSYYCHLSEIKCEVGAKVNQYSVIALSGNTGSRSTGPHLHLGLYINGNSVDPGVLFGK